MMLNIRSSNKGQAEWRPLCSQLFHHSSFSSLISAVYSLFHLKYYPHSFLYVFGTKNDV